MLPDTLLKRKKALNTITPINKPTPNPPILPPTMLPTVWADSPTV